MKEYEAGIIRTSRDEAGVDLIIVPDSCYLNVPPERFPELFEVMLSCCDTKMLELLSQQLTHKRFMEPAVKSLSTALEDKTDIG
jgi:ABC-type enterochelin transport system permease subunit